MVFIPNCFAQPSSRSISFGFQVAAWNMSSWLIALALA